MDTLTTTQIAAAAGLVVDDPHGACDFCGEPAYAVDPMLGENYCPGHAAALAADRFALYAKEHGA